MERLKNKVAIITGGTGGLGKAVVSAFLSEGARVFSTYIVKDELEECLGLKEEYGEKLVYGKADVTKAKDMSKVVDRAINNFGRIDFLINIVGGFAMAQIVDTDEVMWDRMMNMNLKSVFICSKSVLPQMIKQKYGRIIRAICQRQRKPIIKILLTFQGPISP